MRWFAFRHRMVCPVKCAMPCISSCIFKDIGSLWGSGMRFRKVILAFPTRHFDLTTNFYELNSKLEGIGCCCSVTKSCPTLCNPMGCSTPDFVLHHFPEFTQSHSTELVMPFIYFILCLPLLLLPSVFPSFRVFSNESALQNRWPKDWSFTGLHWAQTISQVLF